MATTYYVDPDWGGTSSGTSSHPWNVFTSSEMATVDTSLASGAVTVYFSALKADGTTQQSKAWFIHVARKDYSGNRLTLDGYSFYNSNITTPAWLSNPDTSILHAYQNGKVFKTTGDGSSAAIGWNRVDFGSGVSNGGLFYLCTESHLSAAINQPGVGANWTQFWAQIGNSTAAWNSGTAYVIGDGVNSGGLFYYCKSANTNHVPPNTSFWQVYGYDYAAWSSGVSYGCLVKQNNITIRGFEITGVGARTTFNGDNFIWEYNNVHDITTIGAAVTFLYHSYPDSSLAQPISAPCVNETMRFFRVVNTFGEAVYIGALNPSSTDAFEAAQGNQRNGVYIHDFYINGPGANGAQGDGIDCKHGILGLHIADGEIGNGIGTGNGINVPLTATNVDQASTIERVYVHDFSNVGGGGLGISAAAGGTLTALLYGHTGTTIRNCIVANCLGSSGISINGFHGTYDNRVDNCAIINNTVYGTGGIGISMITNIGTSVVKNNFVFGVIASPSASISSTGVTSDYNCHDNTWTWTSASEGAHTVSITRAAAQAAVTNYASSDFTLVSSSALRGAAETQGTFTDDFTAATRASPWDISAYNFAHTGVSGTSFTGVGSVTFTGASGTVTF